MNFTTEQLTEMVVALKELGIVTKHDPASTASTWTAPHGLGGIFSQGAVRPDMYSTVPRATNTFSGKIPLIQSRMDNEIYEILTGVTATQGTRAVDICSEGPTPGRLKVCRQVIPFGQVKVDTEVNRLSDFGRRLDYQDLNRNVVNFQASLSPFVPQVPTTDLNDRLGKQFAELGVGIELGIELVDFVGVAGSGSNDAYLNQFITQYAGLESLVKTGHTDSVSGVACTAADSIVIAHNAPIGSNGVNGASFISNMVDMYFAAKDRARIIGMEGTIWAFVMHPKAWRAVAEVWACAYWTDRCSGGQYNEVNRDAMEITRLRDEMYRGQYLLVDGEAVPVELSTGIPATGVSNNVYNTDIYLIPMNWAGRPLLYRQYFPLNNGEAMTFLGMENDARVINNGLYAVGKRSTNGLCTKFEFYSKHRLILDTPFLAGRLNDVQVTFRALSLDVRVGESLYRDGGQSTRF
jgi:hypothetical protein